MLFVLGYAILPTLIFLFVLLWVGVPIFMSFVSYYTHRRLQGKVCQAIADALVRIAENSLTPELRSALPDLKIVAADVLQYDRQTRASSRQAVRRIEVLTEALKNLPLPASAPAPDAATLPRVVEAASQNTETLPRVVEESTGQ